MKLIRREPDKAYLDTWLWVPKQFVNVYSMQSALSFTFVDKYTNGQRVLQLWKETEHHLLVPRAFWDPATLPYPTVDCRPRSYKNVEFKSRIKLDHQLGVVDGKEVLVPTGDDVQRRSLRSLQDAMGGTLQLACIAGSTELNLNRGGKGFKTTIRDAWLRFNNRAERYNWDQNIPTYIRSLVGDQVELQRVIAIVHKGIRFTYRLKLEDGKSLFATADHEILTPSGYKQLGQLKAGDDVVVDGRRSKSIKKEKLSYKRIAGFKYHPYGRPQTRSHVVEEHRAIVEAAMNGLTLEDFKALCTSGKVDTLTFIDPGEFHVHHKDGNIHNNVLDNLEVLPKEQHLKHHRPGYAAFGRGVPTRVRVATIEMAQHEEVFDVMCEGPHHNFVANGIVVHNCGKGKTVVALENVHVEKVPALIVVDNSQLLEQWNREVQKMLEVPGGVGCLDGKHDDWKGRGIVLATYQTLSSRAGDLPEEFRRYFGGVYFDEGHHVSAPVFSRCVDLVYGKRYSLTATPERDDGWHIISDYHVGKVLYRDLRQPMKPLIIFKATHFELNIADPLVAKAVLVKNEVHISKLMSYFGSWRDRLLMVTQDAYEAVQAGRKVLVLSNSVDEVVNLMTMWTRGLQAPLYSDIPVPTAADVGETTSPIFISATDLKKLERSIARLSKSNLVDPAKLQELELQLAQAKVGSKIQLMLAKKQATFLKDLIKEPSTAGVMTYGVPPKLRQRFLDERSVVFAITKYGREGMDCPTLDTVIVSTPFSSKNNMQQLMGRPTRYKLGKRMPVIIIYEDSIGQCYGMCQKLRKHLRSWPHEEGGPFEYEMIGNPRNVPCKIQTLSQAFGL